MNTFKKVVSRTKHFVADHRVAVAVLATTAVWYKLNKMALKDHNEFLVEKGLYEEFYTPSDEAA